MDWLTLSPNPATDYVVVKFDKAPLSNQAKLELIDAQGRLLSTYEIENNNGLQTIPIFEYESGVYTLSVVDFGYHILSQKLIVH